MNGTVLFGVALIAAGLFFSGQALLPLLIGGVLVAAYGAFMPPKRPTNRAPQRMPSEADPWT